MSRSRYVISGEESLAEGQSPSEAYKARHSIAVVAFNKRKEIGAILYSRGKDLEKELEEFPGFLDELGLDDAPDGISIWEGFFEARITVYPKDKVECYSTHPVGRFRKLTDKEWAALKRGFNPLNLGRLRKKEKKDNGNI